MSAELLHVWAKLVLEGAIRGGVSDIVIAPGSRSTPFALTAARHPALRCHSIIDERSAAFVGLGLARLTNRPTLVLCTSGTAGAHFLPAALEAAASCVPLLFLTADRPFELHDCGAPQTLDQSDLLKGASRRFVDLGEPTESESALRAVYRRVVNATLTTRTPLPGPVHMNARVRKPLEPTKTVNLELERTFRRIRDEGPAVHPPAASPIAAAALDPIARDLDRTRRGLIVCGALPPTLPPDEIHALARRTALPLVAEAASQARFHAGDVLLCDGIDALLVSPAAARAVNPDTILQIGAAPLTPAWSRILEGVDRYHVLHPHTWSDPTRRATSMAIGDVERALRELCATVAEPSGELREVRQAWARDLSSACRTAWQAVAKSVHEADGATLSEASVLRQVSASLPPDGVLALGNSLPIRELERFVPAWTRPHPVVVQRGANGIDGLVSGAVGLASVRSSVTLVLGDISFLHDLGGLWATREVRGQLVLVVINNQGGRIFEQLPIATAAEPRELSLWTTPHDLDLAHAAHLFDLAFERATTPDELDAALGSARQRTGCTIVEARVSPDSPVAMARTLERQLESLFGPDAPETQT